MNRRGQAVVELSLALLVLVPTLIVGIFLAESAIFRLKATEAATEPLWDATAYSQQQYEGGFVLSPAAIATAQTQANGRMKARGMVFTQAAAAKVTCGGAADMAFTIGGTVGPYQDNGGISCSAKLTVDAKGMGGGFVDQGRGRFFQEPLSNLRRHFDFCENEKCRPFKMAIGDWGMVNQGSEPDECKLTMDGCANNGFFGKAKQTYVQNTNLGGVKGRDHIAFVDALMNKGGPPAQYDRVTDFQMSYQGEPDFMETVPVIEGDKEWRTTPFLKARKRSYDARSDKFLGM